MNQEFASSHTTIDKIVSAGDYVTAITSRVGTTKDGKVAESWISIDRLGIFQQIGIVPETAELQRQAGMRPQHRAEHTRYTGYQPLPFERHPLRLGDWKMC